MSATRLTARERDILALMAKGLTYQQIASRLTLAPSTVRWYARQIFNRLGAENREDALARAADLGLISGAEPPAPPPHNLPVPATPFVGRTAEVARLNRLLADPSARLITIAGPGGMGKTRLALAVAASQLQPGRGAGAPAQRYPDGIWFITLSALTNAHHLIPAFAEALGVQLETKTGRSPLAQLLDSLKQKRALLVVDNFEHLVEAADFLSTIVAAAGGVQLLVTSRERLQIPGEQVLALEGLEVPEPGLASLAGLATSAAAQLLLNTARRVQPNLALTDADAAAVVRICQAVAGMPLGIELAASWASVLPLRDIAQEVENNLELLAADWRGTPDRHRSMQAALDTSWQRLTASQQAAFRALCAFRGGFTRQAAYAVVGATLPLLVTLVNKSWLTYDPGGDRYHIHELLRQYGRQQLAANPALERATRASHSAYYAAWLEQGAPNFSSRQQLAWVVEMKAELGNIEPAWEWAIQAGEPSLIGQGMESLARFYEWVGRLADGEAALGQAAERLASLANAQPHEAELRRLRARALIWQGRLSTDLASRRELLAEAQALLEQPPAGANDLRAERALLLFSLSDVVFSRDRQQAIELLEQALELYEELGDQPGIAACLNDIGATYWIIGRLEQAAPYVETALRLRRSLGDEQGAAEALNTLALIRKHQGQWAEAERLHREVLESHRRQGSRLGEVVVLGNLSSTLATTGKYGEMLELAQQAVALAKNLGGSYTLWPDVAYASALQHHGRYPEAREIFLEVEKAARRAGRMGNQGFALLCLGQMLCATREYEQAERLLAEAAAIFSNLQDKIEATPVGWLGYVYRALADFQKAWRQVQQALRLVLDRRSALSLLDCLPVAALLAADQGKLERAAELHALTQTFAYIANSRWFADVAGRELDAVVARLPAEAAEAAARRGRALDLWQTAEALAEEIGG